MIPNYERYILASRAGAYSEAPTIPALRAHFRCIWTHFVADQRTTRIAVVPDGCVDLLWRDGRFVVVGPDTSVTRTVLSSGATIVGLRFRPGAAALWLGMSVAEIVGQQVPMTEIWGQSAGRVEESLSEVSSAGRQAVVLQELMADRAANLEHPAREALAVFELLGGRARSDGTTISSLHDRLNMSERTLRRWSADQFGYGLKTLDRILRFQRFRTLTLAHPGDRLAGLAFESGYADQAHLNREIQTLCGMTAKEFVSQLAG